MISITTPPEAAGLRLDQFLSDHEQIPEGISRSRIKQWIQAGNVLVAGEKVKPRTKLASGDEITINPPPPVKATLKPVNMKLDVLFEDEALLVINKPAPLTVHPGAGVHGDTLVNAALAIAPTLSDVGGEKRLGIVHRLDKETSGVIVLAKDNQAHLDLARQFAARSTEKVYEALVVGVPKERGEFKTPIERHPVNRKKMTGTLGRGREAETQFTVLEAFAFAAHVRVLPKTGRTHQIRVHFAEGGFPVLADKLYGKRIGQLHATVRPAAEKIDRQALHASRLTITHPKTSKRLTFEAPLPADMQAALDCLRKNDASAP